MLSFFLNLFYLVECYSNYDSYDFDPCSLPKLPDHHNGSQMVRENGILFAKQITRSSSKEDIFELKVISKFDFRGFMLYASTNEGINNSRINEEEHLTLRRASWVI